MTAAIPLARPDIGPDERAAINRVIASPVLSRGPEKEAFEREFAGYLGVEDAVAVSSGTAALHLAYKAAGIGHGDAVITSAFTVPAAVNAIELAGAVPQFVDIDPQHRSLAADRVVAALSAETKAISVVHLFGLPAPLGELEKIAGEHGLVLVEDACQALGTRVANRFLGGFGAFGCFGFYPNKQVTTGEGGVVIASAERGTRLRRLANQGRSMTGGDDFLELGFNYRLPELSAALGRAQLARIESMIARRRRLAALYYEGLQGLPLRLPPKPATHVRWSPFAFVIEVDAQHRDALRRHLAAGGIATGVYFPPLHLQPALRDRSVANQRLPETERLARRVIALPFSSAHSEPELSRVIDETRQFFTSAE